MSTDPIVRLADDLYEARMQANEAIRQRDALAETLRQLRDHPYQTPQSLRQHATHALASIQEEA